MMTIEELVTESYRNSKEKGWYDEPDRTFGEEIALIHSEASEALEEHRDGRKANVIYFKDPQPAGVPYDTIEWAAQGHKPEGVGIELADVIIRCADMCGRYGIDLEAVLRIKQAFNRTRPRKHGGKAI